MPIFCFEFLKTVAASSVTKVEAKSSFYIYWVMLREVIFRKKRTRGWMTLKKDGKISEKRSNMKKIVAQKYSDI